MTDPSDQASIDAKSRILQYRSTPYGIAPYLRLTGADPHQIDDPIVGGPHPLPVRAVAISPSPNGDSATESVYQLLEAHGYRHVPVIRSRIPFRG